MKHPLFSTGNTHNWEILRGKHASSEGHSRWNPWRRYSFNHRPSGHPARSYMLRWSHLLGTRVSSRDGILFVKSHGCCTFSYICHCNRHILRQMSRYFMVDFGKVPKAAAGSGATWATILMPGFWLDPTLQYLSYPRLPVNNLTSLCILHVPRRPTDQALSHLIRPGFSWHAILGTRNKGGNCLVGWVI